MAKKAAKGGGRPIAKVEIELEPTPAQTERLLAVLQQRFEQNMARHDGLAWPAVRARLDARPEKLASLHAMEHSGGEPDVIGVDAESGEIIFCDCAAESPAGRRSICYNGPALRQREKKGVFPGGSAVEIAAKMGVELLDEDQYRRLQQLGEFDCKTSSWIATPADIRKRGGALFADRRYDHVFIYHNGAPSFYAGRGFRATLRV